MKSFNLRGEFDALETGLPLPHRELSSPAGRRDHFRGPRVRQEPPLRNAKRNMHGTSLAERIVRIKSRCLTSAHWVPRWRSTDRQANWRLAAEKPAATPSAAGIRDERLRRVESILFLAKDPIASRKLAQYANLADATEARTLVRRLNQLYDENGQSFRVEEVAGGFQLLTRSKFARWLRRLDRAPREVRLSVPALETLAVVAYRQPSLRAEIEAIRGVSCGEILRQLMERDLVRICGRSEELGRPYLYATTKNFLQVFGLRNLDGLPRGQELKQSQLTLSQTIQERPERSMEEDSDVLKTRELDSADALDADFDVTDPKIVAADEFEDEEYEDEEYDDDEDEDDYDDLEDEDDEEDDDDDYDDDEEDGWEVVEDEEEEEDDDEDDWDEEDDEDLDWDDEEEDEDEDEDEEWE